jgi:hypothetical protein
MIECCNFFTQIDVLPFSLTLHCSHCLEVILWPNGALLVAADGVCTPPGRRLGLLGFISLDSCLVSAFRPIVLAHGVSCIVCAHFDIERRLTATMHLEIDSCGKFNSKQLFPQDYLMQRTRKSRNIEKQRFSGFLAFF